MERIAKDASFVHLEQHWQCIREESKYKDGTIQWALPRKKVGQRIMAYNIVHSNDFSAFKCNGQQCVFLKSFSIFGCKHWLQLPLCKCRLVMEEAYLNLFQLGKEDFL